MYKEGTIFFSQDSVAMITHVIPTMDQIDNAEQFFSGTALSFC